MRLSKHDGSDWTLGEVKAVMARQGVDVPAGVAMREYERPTDGAPVGICVVEAVETVRGHPDYGVYGLASCIACERLCYLGSETVRVVLDREQNTFPLCIECAHEHLSDSEPQLRLQDEPAHR